jgi:hypothetical protein
MIVVEHIRDSMNSPIQNDLLFDYCTLKIPADRSRVHYLVCFGTDKEKMTNSN